MESSITLDAPTSAVDYDRAAHLVRRLNQLLFDLRLDRVLSDWASPGCDGIRFAPLGPKQAAELLRVLEDLVAERPPTVVRPGPNQLQLFDGGPASGAPEGRNVPPSGVPV
jgi:hypothetical protein